MGAPARTATIGSTPRWQPWLGALLALAMVASLASFVPRLAGVLDPPAADASLTPAQQSSIAAQMAEVERRFVARPDGTFAVHNATAGVVATLGPRGLTVRDQDLRGGVTLATAAFGRPDRLVPLAAGSPSATDLTATVAHGPVVEWFRNREAGLEQGWTVPERPSGTGPFVLDLAVTGGTANVLGDRSARLARGDAQLSYDGLAVHDATGRDLPARFVAIDGGLRIRVDDRRASYPIVVDPVLSAVDHLEGTPNDTQDLFGFAVAIERRWMAVGAAGDRLSIDTTGAGGKVYVYFDQSGNGDWELKHQLTHMLPGNDAPSMGSSVAVDVEPQGVTIVSGGRARNRVVVWTIPGDPVTQAPGAAISSPQVLNPAAYPGRGVGLYGNSVSLDAGLLAVGAPTSTVGGMFVPDGPDVGTTPDTYNEQIGLVEVLRRTGGFGSPFAFEARLDAPSGLTENDPELRDVQQQFGTWVAVSGDIVAVGAPGDDGVLTRTAGSAANPRPAGVSARQGAVHVFRKGDTAWAPAQVVVPDQRRDGGLFGTSLALADGDLLVGEPGSGVNRAHLYDHHVEPAPAPVPPDPAQPDTHTWAHVKTWNNDDPTTPADESTQAAAQFGMSVDFDDTGRLLAVGARQQSVVPIGGVGSVLLYERPGTAAADEPVFRQLVPGRAHRTTNDDQQWSHLTFGHAVAVDSGRLVVGAFQSRFDEGSFPGAAATYADRAGTYELTEDLRPVGHRFEASFGARIAQDGDVLAVLAPRDRRASSGALSAGAIYLFRRVEGAWTYHAMFHPGDFHAQSDVASDWGASLALHVRRDADGNETGIWVAVGAPGDDDVDRDGRGETHGNEVVGANVGTVGVWGRSGGPGKPWAQWASELWAGGHVGVGTVRPEQFDPADFTDNGRFGASVAFTGDGTLVVGEPGAAGGVGAIHRYDTTGVQDAWSPSFTHRETVPGTAAGTEFGREVAADGTRVVVASRPGNDLVRLSTFTDGAAADPLAAGTAFQVGLEFLGVALDVRGDRLAVGSPTSEKARVYRFPQATGAPLLEGEFSGDPTSDFGIDVALNRGGEHPSLVVGAPNVPGGVGTANVYIARTSTGGQITTWSEAATLAAPATGDRGVFGQSVTNAPAKGGVLVGLPLYDEPETDAGRVFRFETAALAPPAGPKATVDVSAPAEVPVGTSYIPTAGLAPSLLTENQTSEGGIAATPLSGIDLSQPPAGTDLTASPLSGIPLSGIPLSGIPLSGIPLSGIPLSGIGWEEVLEGTDFDGLPLQSVTLQEVYELPSVQALTLGQIGLADSPLSGIPLSGIALAGAPLSGIELDPESSQSAMEQWCAALEAAGADTTTLGLDCADPGNASNSSATIMGIALKGAPLSGIPLSGIPLSGIPLSGIPLSGIPLSGIDLAASPLSGIPLSGIPLSGIPLSGIPLSGIPLSGIPLSGIPLSGIELGGTPLSGIPLSGIDIAGSPLSGIPLSGIDLQGAPLSGIPLSGIPLSGIPLSGIPLSGIELGGTPLSGIPLSGIDLQSSPLSGIPLSGIPLSGIGSVVDCTALDCQRSGTTLGDAARAGAIKSGAKLGDLAGAFDGIRLGDLADDIAGYTPADFQAALGGKFLAFIQSWDDVELGELPVLWQYFTLGDLRAALNGIRLGDIAGLIDGYTADDVKAALNDHTLADLTGWDDLTLGELEVLWQHLQLGDLTDALSGVRLGDLVGIISNGSGGTYSADDLKQALLAEFSVLSDLGPDFDDLTLGELGEYGDTTIGQLLAALSDTILKDITVGDLLLALIARSQYPWEELDLTDVLPQALAESPHSVPVKVAFEAQAPDGRARDVQLTVRPPYGSRMKPGSVELTATGHDDELQPVNLDGALRWTLRGMSAGAVHTLSFELEPTVNLGAGDIKATAVLPADDEYATDTAGVTVVQALEPNGTPANASALPDDTIVLSHVASGSDLDLFRFSTSKPGARVSALLSNLDADLDLVLYGPKASSTTIQETSDRSIVPVEDEDASVIPPSDGVQPLADNDLAAPPDLGSLVVHGRSLRRGRDAEQIDALLQSPGTYYVAVSGYNGATNREPYALRMKRLAGTAPACPDRSVAPGPVSGSLPAALNPATETVFLFNESRMAGLHGAAGAAQVKAGLDALVGYVNGADQDALGVHAQVLAIDADAGVRAAYAAWDASACDPDSPNGVAAEIVRVLDKYRDAGAKLKHIVVVGGDDAIPFARVPDKTAVANEKGYASTFGSARHALQASLAGSYVQTDDAYGDVDPYEFGDRVLFVTDAAVGRLVESPAEIVDQLEDFVAAQGKLAVGTGLVTGYDFLTDGAGAVADELKTPYDPVNRSLISDTWTRQDLEDAISDLEPDVASINAHFDHFRALPGLGNSTHDESDLFTAAAVRGTLAGDLARAVVFSMGCHSGLSASDQVAGDGLALDFAQAIAAQGGVFVGNTGYGYGDTELVELSERLMTGYAKRLDGALSVGEALRYAKAEYAADLTLYGVYDEKALMEATFYGLPFYRLAVDNPPPLPPLPPAPVISPDPIAGIDTTRLAVFPDFEQKTTEDGDTYWVGVGDGHEEETTAVHDRPVQPRTDESFVAPDGTQAHDALVLGLTTTDTHGVSPHIHQPIVDDADEAGDAPVDVAFPSSPVRVNPEETPRGETFKLTATTGYFRTTADDGSGIQRLVDEMAVTPYFADEDVHDFVRPTFAKVDAAAVDGTLSLAVDVADDRGEADRVKRVYVMVLSDPRHGVSKQWQTADLVRTDGSRWTGSLPVDEGRFEYIVQAVDAAGNVAVTTNKGVNFREQAESGQPPASGLKLKLDGTLSDAGWYRSAVTVTASGGSGLTFEVVGEVSERPYDGPFQVSGEGPHFVIVRSGDGQSVARTIRIDTVGPRAIITQPQNGSVVAYNSGTTAQFACLDGGSGVTSCDATLTVRQGFGGGTGTTKPAQNGDDVSGTIGKHTLKVTTGPDVAGNPADPSTATSDFTVAPPPRIGAVNLPDNPGGKTRSVNTTYSGTQAAAPYTTTYDWGDGKQTTCTSGKTTSDCTATLQDGAGSTTGTHTWPDLTARTVDVTVADRAGQTSVGSITFNKTTALSATPAQVKVGLQSLMITAGTVSATLVEGDGDPMAGREITFQTVLGLDLCKATTNASGVASCPQLTVSLGALLALRYSATFAGDSTHLKVSATAPLG